MTTGRCLPILFSAPMIRAILEGRKTQTRRLVNLPHNNPLGVWEPTSLGGRGCYLDKGMTKPAPERVGIWHTRTGDCIAAPKQVGDRLWVRESYTEKAWGEAEFRMAGLAGRFRIDSGIDFHGNTIKAIYRADGEYVHARWKPSIHMPRWVSRITLEVTGVRCERLQAITEEDAIAEGCEEEHHQVQYEDLEWSREVVVISARDKFQELWNSIHGADAWDANPYVWVYEFRRSE